MQTLVVMTKPYECLNEEWYTSTKFYEFTFLNPRCANPECRGKCNKGENVAVIYLLGPRELICLLLNQLLLSVILSIFHRNSEIWLLSELPLMELK